MAGIAIFFGVGSFKEVNVVFFMAAEAGGGIAEIADISRADGFWA